MTDIVKKSNIKKIVSDLNIADETYKALDDKVSKILQEAANRARLNNRKTLLARDL